MPAVDLKVYGAILSVRPARRFDIACLLMRMYGYMMNIGTVAMLSLAGYSFLESGLVSSVIALAIFLIGPRLGKRSLLRSAGGRNSSLGRRCGT